MAEVILFRPAERYSRALGARRVPLGLAHLAAPLIERGISVTIIDALVLPDWRETLRAELGEETVCVGVGVMTGHPIQSALEFSQAVKDSHSAPVVWGGTHPSLLPEQTLENELVDMVIVGEAEDSFLQLVESLRAGESDLNVPGLHYHHQGQLRAVGAQRPDLDRLPPPAYDLIDMEKYIPQQFRYLGNRDRCIELNTDRGCPHRCAFCYNARYNQRRWRPFGAATVLERIEQYVDQYRVGGVNFVGDNFFVNKNRVGEICQGILDRKLDITWHADIRIDNFMSLDDDLVELVRKSGCTCLTFGVESGSDRMLTLIQKDISVRQVKLAHQRAREYGFLLNYHFMLGLPDETERDVLDTLDLIAHLTEAPEAMIYGPSIYTPFPGTRLYDRAVTLGFQPPQRLEDWIDHDRSCLSAGPWVSKSHAVFLEDATQLARTAYSKSGRMSFPARMLQSYARLRFAGFQRGVRFRMADVKIARLARSVIRRRAA